MYKRLKTKTLKNKTKNKKFMVYWNKCKNAVVIGVSFKEFLWDENSHISWLIVVKQTKI